MMKAYTLTTTGRYGKNHAQAGKRVLLFAKVGRRFAHVEIGRRAFRISAL